MKGRVVFRADGNLTIGYGHFIRTLGIASLICDDFECIYATKNPTEYQIREIVKVCKQIIYVLNDDSNFIDNLRIGDIVVLDTYEYQLEYQQSIREKGCKLVYIDDHIDKFYVSDAIINNIPGFIKTDFRREIYTRLFLGIDYALLRKEFLDSEIRIVKKKVNQIFLSFGGADYLNLSMKFIPYLKQINSQFEINVVVGDGYKYIEDLQKSDRIIIFKNLNASEMALLMASSEVCIIPSSSLLNEAASIGSKILTGYFTDNQIKPYEFFIQNKLAVGVGDYRKTNYDLFKSQFLKVMNDKYMIKKQHQMYRFQQEINIRNIFYELQ